MISAKILMPSVSTNGNIKIGKKGVLKTSKQGNQYRQPEKQPFFTITTLERDDSDNFIIDNQIMDMLKASAKDTTNPRRAYLDKDGNIIGIPIRCLYDDIELNFPTRLASYSGTTCICSGNGEKAVRVNPKTNVRADMSCPCEKFTNPTYSDSDKCKANGVLSCMIDGSEFFGVCHKFRTTSKNTVKSILGSLALIASVTGGRLAAIPLHLIMSPKTVTSPDNKQQKIQVVSVVFNGFADQMQKEALRLRQDNANYIKSVKLLETQAMSVSDPFADGEKDFTEEFYPEIPEEEDCQNNTVVSVSPTASADDPDSIIKFFEKNSPEIFKAVKSLYFEDVPNAPAKRKEFAAKLKEMSKAAAAAATPTETPVTPPATPTPAASDDIPIFTAIELTEAKSIIAEYPEEIRFQAMAIEFPTVDTTKTPTKQENLVRLAKKMKEIKLKQEQESATEREPGMEG